MISKNQLIELGFSGKEASVYLALLELGPSTTAEISRAAKINRTTGYDILESLVSNGLVNPLGEAKIQKFVAENPDKVIIFLENKIKQSQEKLKQAYNLLPELFSIYNEKEKPKVKYYEGIEAIKEAFEDTLTAEKEIVGYAVGTDAFDAVGEKYLRNYFRRRVEKNIKVRVIAPDDPDTLKVVARDREELRESLLVPRDKFYFTTETNIYNNKVIIMSWKEKFAIVVESREITDAQKKIFELAWLGAKNFQK
ncbi:MAG: helix-turn-helix domain-containing protein [Candidatus Paceibacterota bacterium]|jgi:sugar-specific transcriptional regulator TrmB